MRSIKRRNPNSKTAEMARGTDKRETRTLSMYDIDKMIAEDSWRGEHPIVQQLVEQRREALK